MAQIILQILTKNAKAVLATEFRPIAGTPVFDKKNAHLFRYHIEETMKAHQPEVASGQTFLCGV